MNKLIWKFYSSTDDTSLNERITVTDYTTLLYDVRRQRNELRAEFNIVVKQLEEVRRECDNMGILWRDAVDALATFILATESKP